MSSHPSNTLNPEQKRAVETTEGPLLILAGAGAGKTKTIVERIKNLIRKGTEPESILAITFTNKAAREMRERVGKELDQDALLNRPVFESKRPLISTFHSLGVRILREQSELLDLKKTFKIFDRDDSKKAVKEALEKVGLDPKMHDPGRMLGIISKEKGRGITLSEYTGHQEAGEFNNAMQQVWYEYEKILKRDSAVDFDDLLLKTMILLRDHPKIRKHYQDKWQYIHIDEYQDTNRVQYNISKMLVGEEENICVVGDIDQNIYSWRGADIKNILDFEKDYPKASTITLERNYRSTQTILNAANTIIEKNQYRREKNLFTDNAKGEKIAISSSFDEAGEAEFIASKVSDLIKSGTPADEIAVLYRANFQSRVLEEAFMRHALPYQMLGTRFFERKEVKDILAYLRAALNPESHSDVKRMINVPTRGIGKATIAKIFMDQEESLSSSMRGKIAVFRKLLQDIRKTSETETISETIKFIIKESGLEEMWKDSKSEEDAMRLENAYELVNFASRYDETGGEDGLLAFLADAALQSDQDEMQEEVSATRLMTVHASKGLEFDTVFIAGLEDGLFPHQKMTRDGVTPEESEEERRLFYVALTRARKKVFLSYAQSRTIFGRREVTIPSEFIFDIPEEWVENVEGDFSAGYRPLLDIEF